jgi:hypothetical protein
MRSITEVEVEVVVAYLQLDVPLIVLCGHEVICMKRPNVTVAVIMVIQLIINVTQLHHVLEVRADHVMLIRVDHVHLSQGSFPAIIIEEIRMLAR